MTQEEIIIKYFNLNPSTTVISIKEKNEVNVNDITNLGKEAPKNITYIFSFIENDNLILEKELTKSEILDILSY
jgi:hypothetical protein